jgi:hypothetical protein
LRQVLRCVEWAITNADTHRDGTRAKALRQALSQFDDAVPNAKDLRDILSHFDDYERGRGRLQRDGQPELLLMYSTNGVSFELTLMHGYSIDVGLAADAAAELTESVLAHLS